eukprot:558698-Rhodomonas_salina.1
MHSKSRHMITQRASSGGRRNVEGKRRGDERDRAGGRGDGHGHEMEMEEAILEFKLERSQTPSHNFGAN